MTSYWVKKGKLKTLIILDGFDESRFPFGYFLSLFLLLRYYYYFTDWEDQTSREDTVNGKKALRQNYNKKSLGTNFCRSVLRSSSYKIIITNALLWVVQWGNEKIAIDNFYKLKRNLEKNVAKLAYNNT